jgi:hypothetical protein
VDETRKTLDQKVESVDLPFALAFSPSALSAAIADGHRKHQLSLEQSQTLRRLGPGYKKYIVPYSSTTLSLTGLHSDHTSR